ncbi:EamA family transporter [Thalassomonas actiniarum]|uniref:EamA family transporter n=1 Tax=Thalassomonas actiniarum TaxID=485447 RepID=A0AAE9YNH0_9GAMM|nr:EamA family transporter [Thalassomonas actiniarum]WDD97917.1 EamA family transporter [Thalassomonas actiniarum]
MTLKDSILGFLIIFLWGINFVVIAWGLEGMPPLLMGACRFLLVALIGSLFIKPPKMPWKWLLAYGLTLGFGQFAFLFSAMAFGMPAGLASLVLQSQALFTLLFAALLLKEGISPQQLLAMLIACIGLYLVAGGESSQASAMTTLGFILTLAAAMCWGLGNIVNRTINKRGYQANLGLVIWSAWIPPIPFLLASYYFEGGEAIREALFNIQLTTFAALLYLAVAATIIGYSLWSYLLGRYPAAQIAPLTLAVPVVGLAAAGYFLDEVINLQQWLGIVLVMSGLVLNVTGGQLLVFVKKKFSDKKQAETFD